MNNKKSLLVIMGLGLTILSFGEASFAQAKNHNNSDYTGGYPRGQIISTIVTQSAGAGRNFGRGGGARTVFDGQSIRGGNNPIPQNIINKITGSGRPTGVETNVENFDNSGIVGTSTDIAIVESSSPGNNSDSTITRRATSTETDSLEGSNINESSGSEISPDRIVICLSDPCVPSDSNSANTITVNELARLIEEDLSQSLNDLAAAERGELNLDENTTSQDLTDNPRRIARGQSSNNRDSVMRRDSLMNENCDCVPGERKIVREPANSDNSTISQNFKTVAEARQIVETKLEQSSKFVEQMNQLKPENSIW